ncbi:MAG: NAD(P)H-dependent glycerol-3-phosphate dehydrogenase [Deltaproteobacteria bacterium]|nr:NAD(P)H-dependent glycerol-3-phosphate dehydrogenase [Deltaproteobacteria bacterium]
MERLTVLGAGSWGTTLAEILAQKGHEVTLWVRNAGLCRAISENSENEQYLPGVKLSRSLRPTASLEEALKNARFIVSVIPSHGLREVFTKAYPFISEDAVIVSATKGIEEGTLLTACGVLKEVLAGKKYKDITVLSGPSFAKEVSVKLPAAVSAASASHECANLVQNAFSTPYFRVYTNSDVIGVELGGALKNVIAIAAGISDGLSLGHNARAALITRGLAETSRLGIKMGANPLTFSGLSGLGDLILTCTAPLSRNYTVGFQIGEGRKLKDITGGMKMVAEGVKTSRAAKDLARANGVNMPITEEVCKVLYEGKDPRDAVLELMMRELKGE